MSGPFETERQAADLPAVQAVYAAFRASPGVGRMAPHNHRLMEDACTAAGVQLGAYDHRILAWLAGWEPSTCAVIAGLISRAHLPELEEARGALLGTAALLDPGQLGTILDALDVAAEYKRDRAATCGDCDASPADLCGTCEWRLARADEYDALAEALRRQP